MIIDRRNRTVSTLHVLNGTQAGQQFALREGANYVGRSSDNDIPIEDKTVSRKHLRIQKKGDKYYLSDLSSRNGTFFDGNYLAPGLEVEVKEGVPIAVGMSMICIGRGCQEEMILFLDSVGLTKESGGESGIFEQHRDKTNQKKLELLYRVSDVLAQNLPIRETCEKMLDHIFDLLKRIDRGVFILIDSDTQEITQTVSKPGGIVGDLVMSYLRNVVQRVIRERKPLVISNVETEKDELADTLRVLKVESVLCVPMIWKSDIIGFIYVDSLERPYGFRAKDLYLLKDLGQRIALAVMHAQFVNDLTTIADSLDSHI
jgi:adenylate cyclase